MPTTATAFTLPRFLRGSNFSGWVISLSALIMTAGRSSLLPLRLRSVAQMRAPGDIWTIPASTNLLQFKWRLIRTLIGCGRDWRFPDENFQRSQAQVFSHCFFQPHTRERSFARRRQIRAPPRRNFCPALFALGKMCGLGFGKHGIVIRDALLNPFNYRRIPGTGQRSFRPYHTSKLIVPFKGNQ